MDELERLVADVRAVELRAIREDDGVPAFDAVDDWRRSQVIEGLGEHRIGGVHLPSLARERNSSTACPRLRRDARIVFLVSTIEDDKATGRFSGDTFTSRRPKRFLS